MLDYRFVVFLVYLIAAGPAFAQQDQIKLDPAKVEFFEAKIRPVLVDHCYDCHSADETSGGLRLDDRDAVARGGESGRVVVPGNPDASLLIKAVRYKDDFLQMPPDGKLPDAVIADLEQWVKLGAPDPRDDGTVPSADDDDSAAARHWAFQLPKKPVVPGALASDWPRSDIDRLVLARLASNGISPSPDATRDVLIRRLYYDVIGLPPTYEQVQSFATSESPGAYEQLVDELLDSPHFGERWARYWLDVSRFSDTKGYVFQEDRNYPHAYKYRDWVIDAFNRDMPVDRFLKYQLAADRLIDGDDRSELAALGYLTLGRRFINNVHDVIDDRIDVVGRGLMGLTVTCARCHDHKYDPITMKDYYGLYGVFFSTEDKQEDGLPLGLRDKDRPVDVGIFIRGNPAARGDTSPRGYLDFFVTAGTPPVEQGSGRLELAEAIACADNPLTARVFVNRVWLRLFGEGLVRTPSDFGLRSDPPAHGDVLDLLAVTFVEDGWSLKRLIRRLVLSSVYRQASDERADAAEVDPENLLFWRTHRRRLDFEAMRDSLLSVSGQLDRSVGGPSVELGPDNHRRTLYAFLDRQNLPGVFRTFDFASPDTHSPARPRTTVPQQSLYLMNNPFAQTAAERAIQATSETEEAESRVRQLYQRILSRDPEPDELQLGIGFVNSDDKDAAQPPTASPWQFGYGFVDGENGGQVRFQPLPHFAGDAWQGGPDRPDAKLGWVLLTAQGGHTGDDQQHAAIRRWTAPQAGILSISGRLKHPADQGDGVRARIVSSRHGQQGEWVAQNSESPTNVADFEVQTGDNIDLITDCRDNCSFDSFTWTATLYLSQPQTSASRQPWTTEAGFHGPLPQPLDLWQQYAQALMLTNEFLFLD